METSRLRFRKVTPDDYDRCLPFFQHPLSHRYWKTEGQSPEALCDAWMNRQRWRYENGKGGALALIDKESHALVGWCGLLIQEVDQSEVVEVGYSIMPDHWGKGYATEASRACIDHAFNHAWCESIISIIQVDNIESRRVAEKNGMTISRETTYHGNEVFIYVISKSGS
ncbi:MAG: GNAT family N-acetyltransferase [Cyclobacteriaceae bacterium]|nr:GNAT family N-acetyltransferase [Cyclobacteriaceae bacterium]